MLSRILIANRGEVALRIVRACRELGVETVAVFSKVDENSLHLQYADDCICIGPGDSARSYLNIPSIISAAEIADVDAIHPGWGFLAENPEFADICEASNIVFIGPKADVMKKMGDKSEARKIAEENRIPVVPGSESTIETPEEALEVAHRIGFPVMLKAKAGGGGRGIRIAHNDISLKNSFALARQEAEVAFKEPGIYIEKYLENPRHIEIQILADNHGNVVHLGERDCSLQRRRQKLIEESPSPFIDSQLREELGRAALKLARAVGYTNAGTVEFLVEKNRKFYFCEMNTRLQVEHPVTEMVTGVDLVKLQLAIASGEEVRLRQKRIKLNGVAIECRINAEDPDDDFRPSPGDVTAYVPPGGPGIRVDSHVYAGYRIPPTYDSCIGKIIVHQEDRSSAIACMKRALTEYIIEGVKTTIPLYLEIFGHSRFVRGDVDTGFVEGVFGKG